MKKLLFLFGILFAFYCQAQKIAFVDTDRILEKIPDYKSAQDKLNGLAVQYQKEIQDQQKLLDDMNASFQADKILLSQSMRDKRVQEISKVQDMLSDLRKNRFGTNGDLFKERQKMVKPIQDKVYKAIQKIAESGRYAFVLDSSSQLAVLYYNDKYDKTEAVLKELGYL